MSEKKLKICFLAATLGKGGAEKQAYYLLKTLTEHGYQLKLIYFEPEDAWKAKILDLGVEVVHIADTSKISRLRKAYRLIRKEKFHVLHTLHYHIGPYAMLLALATGAKPIGAFRRDGDKELLTVNKYIRGLMFRVFGTFICNSRMAMEKLSGIKHLKGKVHYLPNIVEIPDLIQTNSAEQPSRFLAINSLVERKRIDLMLQFIVRFRKLNPGATLTVLGDGPLRTDLESMAKSLGLENHVSFKGQVDNVADYYQQADVFMMSSESEGTPNVVLEAMSHGKVIISSRVGEVEYLLDQGKYGTLLDFEKESSLETVCKRLSENWEELKEMGQKANLEIQERHSYTHLYSNISSIYQKL